MHAEACAPGECTLKGALPTDWERRLQSAKGEGCTQKRALPVDIHCNLYPATPSESSFSPLLIVWLFPEEFVYLMRAETGALMMRGYATRTCRNGACCIWGRSYLYFAFQLLLSIFSLSFPIVFLFEREGGATINVSGTG